MSLCSFVHPNTGRPCNKPTSRDSGFCPCCLRDQLRPARSLVPGYVADRYGRVYRRADGREIGTATGQTVCGRTRASTILSAWVPKPEPDPAGDWHAYQKVKGLGSRRYWLVNLEWRYAGPKEPRPYRPDQKSENSA
jgi:hypothetical protein